MPALAAAAAADRGSVEIPFGITDQSRGRLRAIGSAFEGVEHGLLPLTFLLPAQFEHRSVVVGTTVVRGSIDIPLFILDQSAIGIGPVVSAKKAVKHSGFARLTQLEHRSVAIVIPEPRGPVEIPLGIHNHSSNGDRPVVFAHEPVQHSLLAGLTQLEDRSEPVQVASRGSPVEVPLSVLDHSGTGVRPV